MRNILLRSADANAKPYFFLNEMNKKDLPVEYSTAFWRLFVVLLVLALLRNHYERSNSPVVRRKFLLQNGA